MSSTSLFLFLTCPSLGKDFVDVKPTLTSLRPHDIQVDARTLHLHPKENAPRKNVMLPSESEYKWKTCQQCHSWGRLHEQAKRKNDRDDGGPRCQVVLQASTAEKQREERWYIIIEDDSMSSESESYSCHTHAVEAQLDKLDGWWTGQSLIAWVFDTNNPPIRALIAKLRQYNFILWSVYHLILTMSVFITELSGLPISHAEPQTSFESLQQLFLDTNINLSDAPYFLPSNNIVVGNHSATIPLDREFEISGELCPLQLSWYVTSSWKFEVGGLVCLRNENNRVLQVKKICEVGKDFVVFSVKEHGPLDPQYVKISRLIAPFSSFYNLPFQQCMVYRFFFKQLKTVMEIMGIVKLGRSESSDATMEMDRFPLTTSSEILGAM
ncbi:hypothetical protein PILCRDRAFT_91278 [Piloderma croceum F 1598]|uniref:Uncharacterized protein n=1 Tax=Piloderma croceum (strain F 1598) TaxID=765440 RepID=A0A0C3FB28_PILCF|nr:hypothetical protein PILCRDRAFT_91278 [Piloderma croceum F 1598]